MNSREMNMKSKIHHFDLTPLKTLAIPMRTRNLKLHLAQRASWRSSSQPFGNATSMETMATGKLNHGCSQAQHLIQTHGAGLIRTFRCLSRLNLWKHGFYFGHPVRELLCLLLLTKQFSLPSFQGKGDFHLQRSSPAQFVHHVLSVSVTIDAKNSLTGHYPILCVSVVPLANQGAPQADMSNHQTIKSLGRQGLDAKGLFHSFTLHMHPEYARWKDALVEEAQSEARHGYASALVCSLPI